VHQNKQDNVTTTAGRRKAVKEQITYHKY